MRMLQGLDGREDPFKNYLEVSFIPNFVPPMLQDTLGFSWLYELGMNEDFAGRAIVPAPYSDMAKGDQWNGETSRYAKLIADIGNTFSQEDWLSPMPVSYTHLEHRRECGPGCRPRPWGNICHGVVRRS